MVGVSNFSLHLNMKVEYICESQNPSVCYLNLVCIPYIPTNVAQVFGLPDSFVLDWEFSLKWVPKSM